MANEIITKKEWEQGINYHLNNLRKANTALIISEQAPNYKLLRWLLGFQYQLSIYTGVTSQRKYYKTYSIRNEQVKILSSAIQLALDAFAKENLRLDYQHQRELCKHIITYISLLMPQIKNGYKKSFLRKIVLLAHDEYLQVHRAQPSLSNRGGQSSATKHINSAEIRVDPPEKTISELTINLGNAGKILNETQAKLVLAEKESASLKYDIEQLSIKVNQLTSTNLKLESDNNRLLVGIRSYWEEKNKEKKTHNSQNVNLDTILLELRQMDLEKENQILSEQAAEAETKSKNIASINNAFSGVVLEQKQDIQRLTSERELLNKKVKILQKERDEQTELAKSLKITNNELGKVITELDEKLRKQALALEVAQQKNSILQNSLDEISKLFDFLLKKVQTVFNHREVNGQSLRKELAVQEAKSKNLTASGSPITSASTLKRN